MGELRRLQAMAMRSGKQALQQLRSGAIMTRAHYSVSTAAGVHTAETVEAAEPLESKSVERKKVLVLGGNGYVGTHICKEALARSIPVASLSRSGRPGGAAAGPWSEEVEWVKGDLFHPLQWRHTLEDVSAVISCVGGFGSNEQMQQINGVANVQAIRAASEAGVDRFVFISAHDFGLPAFVLRGYYAGKRAAEDELLTKFPYSGVILRPGFIHGVRQVGKMKIPLNVIGSPLELLLKHKAISQVPLLRKLIAPPVKVATVAKVAVRSATDNSIPPGIMDAWNIYRIGEEH